MRTEIESLPNGNQRLTWRYQEARAEHVAFEREHERHVAGLIAGKVASKVNPCVSLARVSFVADQYEPQKPTNYLLNPDRYQAAAFASKMICRKRKQAVE